MKRLVIIGSSISGGTAACYLKIRFPDLEVFSIQKEKSNHPIVGESLTEFSTLMLHEIGLGSYLEEKHFHKYGLTFYFKEKIDDPGDTTYATHEAMRIPPMPSNQINRFTLDNRLRERAEELGVKRIEGTVKDVSIHEDRPNRLTYSDRNGDLIYLEADWIIDASGRNRLLANKLKLKKTPDLQRSCFWFRLEGFDKSILKQMKEVKEPQHCFDSYYVTHHFFGKSNWIWAIPMRPDHSDSADLISIGIVYRPDLYGKRITSIEDFISRVAAEHPVISKLTQSGKLVDCNAYRNYFYETEKSYSEHGWAIIGDAGDTVDPLYSTGLVMTSIQIKQVAALIDTQRNGKLSKEFVNDLESLYKAIRNALQSEISTLYEVMHDPFQSHLRMHFSSAFYFFFLLPCWLSGYATDRVGARFITKVLEDGAEGFESLKSLLAKASKRLGPLPSTEIKNIYDKTVNWELSGPSETMIPSYLARVCLLFAKARFDLLHKAGWQEWPKHVSLGLTDLAKAALFGLVIRRRALKDLSLIKWMVSR